MKAHKQAGASLLGIATVILVISGIAFVGMKVSPIYFEFFRVDAAMEKLAAQPEVGGLRDTKVRDALLKRLLVDDVSSVKRKQITIKRVNNTMFVTVRYEKRNQALESLDLIGKYERTIELKIPQE